MQFHEFNLQCRQTDPNCESESLPETGTKSGNVNAHVFKMRQAHVHVMVRCAHAVFLAI